MHTLGSSHRGNALRMLQPFLFQFAFGNKEIGMPTQLEMSLLAEDRLVLHSCLLLRQTRQWQPCLSLNTGRTTFCKRFHLLEGRHRRVTRECGQQRAVRPTELHCILFGFACEQPIEKPGRKSVATADTIQHVELARRCIVSFSVNPGHSAPTM